MSKDDKMKLSRRRLLQSAVVVGATAPLLLSTSARAASDKTTKKAAQYQDKPNGNKECSKCRFFIKPKNSGKMGTCQLVQGAISPHGYCMLFTPAS